MDIQTYISSFKHISFYVRNETKEEEYIYEISKKVNKKDISINFNNSNYRFHVSSIFQDFFLKPLIDILNANFTDFHFQKRETYFDEIEIVPKIENLILKESDISFSVKQAVMNFNIALEATKADRLPIIKSEFYINNELIIERTICNKKGYSETETSTYSRSFKRMFSNKKEIKENIRYMHSSLQNIVIKGINTEEKELNEENPVAYIKSPILKGYISKEKFIEVLNLAKYEVSYISMENYSLNRIYKLFQGSDLFQDIKMIKEKNEN